MVKVDQDVQQFGYMSQATTDSTEEISWRRENYDFYYNDILKPT